MKKSSNSAIEENQTLLKGSQRKYPQLFKWKIATIVIIILVAGFGIANIVMAVHLSNHQPRRINYSFVTDVLTELATVAQKTPLSQLMNILTGFSASYSDLYYQHAQILRSWTAPNPPLDLNTLASSFFESNTNQLMILVGFSDANNNNYTGASYTHISFKIPKDDYSSYLQNPNNSYYTFQIDNRQSVLLGVTSSDYLKMDGSTWNLLNCKILTLSATKLILMGSLGISFTSNQVNVGNLLGNQTWDCFQGISSQPSYRSSIGAITNTSEAVTYDLKWLRIFHLST